MSDDSTKKIDDNDELAEEYDLASLPIMPRGHDTENFHKAISASQSSVDIGSQRLSNNKSTIVY